MTPRLKGKLESLLLPVLFGAGVLVIWHVWVKLSGTRVFPTPGKVLTGLAELARDGKLLGYCRDSLLRVSAGYLLGAAVGIPLGLTLGWSPFVERMVNPAVQLLRPISPLAWIPVAIVLFGITDASAVFLIFLSSMLNITVSAMNAVRNVPEIYVRGARNFGLSTPNLFAKVIFPAALPQLLGGLRLALGVAWLVIVAAEMIAVDSGLGYLITDSRNAGQRYDLVIGGMLLIGFIGLLIDVGMRRIETLRAVRWGYRQDA